ncbi:MAG TPA: acetylesterase [Rhodospirillaceae bacterium]|nr:acetylesterase [Rhodospirillaceae bacterium]MAX63447.1 acetylesterase [Rhodospirillaceae bacterium]MBB59232.1 acetylesterase [Rhodospirillaceae bacterium]HAE03491.1 acetylesterase [Rhodospirillaceae bacterium]HAJ22053.1 acetylesterase [Rhodospirillaceae bacterium]|tara:strand:- start:32613 stop:33593 length:981 start_codon:yes stop_codon:yes gene_type:complete
MGLLSITPRLDPQMAQALKIAAELAAKTKEKHGLGDVAATDLPNQRILYNADREFWNRDAPEMAESTDITIDTANGPLALRLHRPKNATSPSPVLIYLHGGGWIVGNLDTHARIMRLLAEKSGWCVLGVDYHLAPEAKFPVPQEDCLAAAQWVITQGVQHGLDPDRIALGGDSAGGNMSMATLLALRAQGQHHRVKAALLYYGSYGLRDSASRRLWGGAEDGLSPQDLAFFRTCLMNSPEEMTDLRFDILANPLNDLPPLYILDVAMDPLADDSVALAQAVQEAGGTIEYRRVEGVLHGFLHMSGHVDAAMTALTEGAAFLRHHAQ